MWAVADKSPHTSYSDDLEKVPCGKIKATNKLRKRIHFIWGWEGDMQGLKREGSRADYMEGPRGF